MGKFIKPFDRFMDKAWIRDGNIIHTGEAMMLACMLRAKKDRSSKNEEELKEILDVYATVEEESS